MPFVFFGNQQTIRLVWLIYGSCLWNHVKANMTDHPDHDGSGSRQSFEPIAIQMQKKKLSVGFAKISRPGLIQHLFSTFYHPYCNKFTLRTSENSRQNEFLFHNSNRHFSKLNLYIFFSALRKYWPLKSAYFFWPLRLAAKQHYLIPFFYGGTYMYGRD